MEKNNRWKYVVGIILWLSVIAYVTSESVYYYAWYGNPDSTLTHVYDEDTQEWTYYWQESPTQASYLNALKEMWFVPMSAALLAIIYGIYMYLTIRKVQTNTTSFTKSDKRIKIGNIVMVLISLLWVGTVHLLNIAMHIVTTR